MARILGRCWIYDIRYLQSRDVCVGFQAIAHDLILVAIRPEDGNNTIQRSISCKETLILLRCGGSVFYLG